MVACVFVNAWRVYPKKWNYLFDKKKSLGPLTSFSRSFQLHLKVFFSGWNLLSCPHIYSKTREHLWTEDLNNYNNFFSTWCHVISMTTCEMWLTALKKLLNGALMAISNVPIFPKSKLTKAALINIWTLTVDQMTVCSVRGKLSPVSAVSSLSPLSSVVF